MKTSEVLDEIRSGTIRHITVCFVNQVFGYSAENDGQLSISYASVLTLGTDGLAALWDFYDNRMVVTVRC